MPARRHRLYLCPRVNGKPGWIMDFPIWWDLQEFFQKYRDRQIDTGNPFYVDYGLLLTLGEAMAWDRQCRETFTQSREDIPDKIVDAMHHFEKKLKTTSWVIVESYEWESGMG